MFITLTINTAKRKIKSPLLRVHKRNYNPAKGWRMAVHMKKRNLLQKFNAWRRSLKTAQYRIGDQVAMF